MAKILSSILVAIVVAQAAAGPTQLSPATENSIGDVKLQVQKAVDAAVAATPPAKQPEARRAALAYLRIMETSFAKAKERGEEKKVTDLILSFEIVAFMVNRVPPEKKLEVMEESFNSVVAPNPMDCPTVDKTYCKMHSKVNKAVDEVVAAAPPEKRLEVKGEILKNTVRTAVLTINKAYADGDDKKIAHVLAAYINSADAVLAAAPAEKLKLMEKTFAAATASAARRPSAA